MDRVAVITLIAVTYERDSIMQMVATETERDLVCTLSSPTRAEWGEAGQQGLKAQWVAKLNDDRDYQGEELAMLNGIRYSIYRTYLTDDGGIELYLRRDVGA